MNSLKRYACSILILFMPVNVVAVGEQEIKVSEADGKALYQKSKKLYLDYERAHGGWVQTKNIRMHYLQWGKENATPLIWANGTYSSSYELAGIAGELIKAGLRVIAIDYYGHGQTEIPQHEVSIYHVADDIAALMDSLGIETAYIGGWSRGGGVSTAFYGAYPDRVKGLILGDGGFFQSRALIDKKTDAKVMESIDRNPLPKSVPQDTEFDLFYHHIKAWKAGNPSNYLPLFPKMRQGEEGKWVLNYERTSQWLKEDSGEKFLKMLRRPSSAPLFQESCITISPKIIFRNLDVPVLIFDPVIENDPFPATQDARQLKQQHGDLVTHKIYEDTGHAFFFQRPKRFVEDVVDFVFKKK